jgi:type II secretory pathway predicted ATPase ExeA
MDYYQHFGLRNNPFEIVGQPASLYMSKAHREGLAALEWGLLHEPGSFTLLIGEVGTGKTTLINVLHGRNYDYARIAYVTNPKLSFEEMLRTILEELGYLPTAPTKLELLKKFEWFFGQLRANERIGIIIDEAQALSDETIEELRLFSNYGTRGKGHLEIMLVGQPELLKRLMSPSLRQFHQQIGARAVLNPLQRDEALEYIDFKLRQSGGSAHKIFARRALAEIIDHSQGIPRQLNLLCNNALIRAYGADLPWVTLKVAQAAIKEYENLPGMVVEFRESPRSRALRSITAHPSVSFIGLGVIALVGLYGLGVRVPSIEVSLRVKNRSVLGANTKEYGEASATDPNRTAPAENTSAPPLANGARPNDALGSRESRPDAREASNGTLADSSTTADSIRRSQVTSPGRTTQREINKARAFFVHNGDTIEGIAIRHLAGC